MAKGRNQPSKIERVPLAIREEMARLWMRKDCSVDDMCVWLRSQGYDDFSRTGMGNHLRGIYLNVETAAARITMSQAVAKAIGERFGDKPDSEIGRLNIQMLNGQVLEMMLAAEAANNAVDENGDAVPSSFNPLDAVRLSTAIQKLMSAEKMNAETVLRVEKAAIEKATKAAAEKAVTVARSKGLSKETVNAIRFAVLGSGE